DQALVRQRSNRQVVRNLTAKPAKFMVHRVVQPKGQNVAKQFPLDPLTQPVHDPHPFSLQRPAPKTMPLYSCARLSTNLSARPAAAPPDRLPRASFRRKGIASSALSLAYTPQRGNVKVR